MADAIKVALITHAVGAHVEAYLQALAATEACSAVVLVDADGKWEADARRILGDKLTGVSRDYRDVFARDKPQLALVTLEAKLAPPVIDAALESNCHVFAEKPACVRAEDFAALVAKADVRHRYLMLALANRTNPEIIEARQMIAAGRIGKLYGIETHIIADQTRLTDPSYHSGWFADRERAGGGHLIWLGIHWLDLMMFLTNSSIVDAAGFTALVGGQPIRIEDSAAAALRFDNGMLGTITSGYYLDKSYHSHIKLWGSHGWLHLQPTPDTSFEWYTTQGEGAGTVMKWTGDKEPRGYTPFVRDAVSACANMSAPPISNADSLRALRTVFGIYSAAESGKSVKVG
jgi:predicted dehydrogenase